MKKEVVLGVVRHVLTFFGGLLVTKGLLAEGVSEQIIGGLVSLVGLVWSVVSKKPSAPVEEVK